MDAPIPAPPFAQGSRRLWKPSAAPNIQWADGFSVADSILGWSCSVVAVREDVPKEVLLFLIPALPLQGMEQDRPGKMQPKDVPFPARAFALSIIPMSPKAFLGGILPGFIATLYIACREAAPMLLHPKVLLLAQGKALQTLSIL